MESTSQAIPTWSIPKPAKDDDDTQDQIIAETNQEVTSATSLDVAASDLRGSVPNLAPEGSGTSSLEGSTVSTPGSLFTGCRASDWPGRRVCGSHGQQRSTPGDWWDEIADCGFDIYDLSAVSGMGFVHDKCHIMGSMSTFDTERASHIPTSSLGSVTTAVEEAGGPSHTDFSNFGHDFSPQMDQTYHTVSSDINLGLFDAPPRASDTVDESISSAPVLSTDFSDLKDMMQYAEAASGSTRPTSSIACTCLQDLTACLFSLRGARDRDRDNGPQIDHFLFLNKQTMPKWKAAETCPANCCISAAFAPLMLMNIQELVSLVLQVTSSVSVAVDISDAQSCSVTVNVGTFTVEDQMDQRLVVNMLLATRIKELCFFISRMSSHMNLAKLDDVGLKMNQQIDILEKAYTFLK